MHVDLQKLINPLLALLVIGSGIVVGLFAGQLVALLLATDEAPVTAAVPQPTLSRPLQQKDLRVVFGRNLFDSSSPISSVAPLERDSEASARPVTTVSHVELTLLGTVVAGSDSLALIQVARENGVYRLGEEVAAEIVIEEIWRKRVVLSDHGQRRELVAEEDAAESAPRSARSAAPKAAAQQAGKEEIASVGNGVWKVPLAVAENARENLSQLLKSARMVPELKDGETVGFKLVGMRRDSLLRDIGLEIGDLVVEINDLALNSPESALQIFQQLREARRISVGLIRDGEAQTFEYHLE